MEAVAYTYLYLRAQLRRQEGQDLVEYMLLVALIAIVVIAAVLSVGGAVQVFFAKSAAEFEKISRLPGTPLF